MMNALNILGLKIELESWDKVKKVPLYISNYFFIQKASINGIYCLSLTPYDVLPPLSSLKKDSKHSSYRRFTNLYQFK